MSENILNLSGEQEKIRSVLESHAVIISGILVADNSSKTTVHYTSALKHSKPNMTVQSKPRSSTSDIVGMSYPNGIDNDVELEE